MNIITGKHTIVVQFGFVDQEIKDFVDNQDLTESQLRIVANILAANTECPHVEPNNTVRINEDNFNDSFYVMREDLRQGFPKK